MRHLLVRTAVVIVVLLAPLSPVVPQASAQLAHDLIHSEVTLTVSSIERVGKRASTLFDSAPADAQATQVEYTGVIVQGYTLSAELTGSWRTVSPTGSASEWRDLYIVRSATDGAFVAGYPGTDVLTDRFQFLINTSDGAAPYIVVAGVFDKRLDDEQSLPRPERPNKYGASSGAVTVTPPPLITRADWNAGPFVSGSPSPLAPSGNYSNMTFHHAAGFSATTYAEGIAQVKAIQDLHQNIRGWSDIGYQFVIDRGGRVYQGRPFLDSSTTLEQIPRLALGAHVGGANTNNIGICLLGCYHPPEGAYCEDQITSQSLATYVTMFAFLGQAYNIPIDNNTLKGHRDFSSTACPGDNNYVLLPSIREQARQAQLFGNEVPEESVLSQNAPNPFSESTSIRYFLKEEGVVDLRVFDVSGREIAKLVDEFQSADRWHEIEFDATGLAAGIYLSRIRVEGFSGEVFYQTRSLVHVE